jgi:hypothetical protein
VCRAAPLTALAKSRVPLVGEKQKAAFRDLKGRFATAAVLMISDHVTPAVLEADCPNDSLGAALSQFADHGVLRLVASMSRKLLPTETNPPIHDKETHTRDMDDINTMVRSLSRSSLPSNSMSV